MDEVNVVILGCSFVAMAGSTLGILGMCNDCGNVAIQYNAACKSLTGRIYFMYEIVLNEKSVNTLIGFVFPHQFWVDIFFRCGNHQGFAHAPPRKQTAHTQ